MTLVSLPMTEDPLFRSHRGYCCTNARVECPSVLEGLADQAAGAGPRTGSCCCSCCRSATSVGEARWSGPPRTASVPNSSAPLSQCLLTAPLHCLPVPPDSSATLSLGRCVTLLLPILLAGVGKQVGSMDEEPQVRGCYNITFICTPTNQETV